MPSFSMTGNVSSSMSFTSSSTSNGHTTTSGSQHTQHTNIGPSGTTVHQTSQTLGEPAREQTRHYDNQGRQLVGGGEERGRIKDGEEFTVEDVTEEEAQKEKDRQYEEKMEDEYAKREGGA